MSRESWNFRRFDQEARTTLLNYYSSQRQHWAIISVMFLGGLFAIFQARDLLFPKDEWQVHIVARLLFSLAIGLIPFLASRLLSYGGLCSKIVSARPNATGNPNDSYLARLEYGVSDSLEHRRIYALLVNEKWALLGIGVLSAALLFCLFSILSWSCPEYTTNLLFLFLILLAVIVECLYHIWWKTEKHSRDHMVNLVCNEFYRRDPFDCAHVRELLERKRLMTKENETYLRTILDSINNSKPPRRESLLWIQDNELLPP